MSGTGWLIQTDRAIQEAKLPSPRFRQRWKAYQHRIAPERLIFVDETWIKTNMLLQDSCSMPFAGLRRARLPLIRNDVVALCVDSEHGVLLAASRVAAWCRGIAAGSVA